VNVKLDENLSEREAKLLRAEGCDVATVAEQGLCAATDRDVAERSAAEGRCLVTLDLDFADPRRFGLADRPGIAVLRTSPRGG
jgi:predicted nuclease of predicted toxin-antitoxin system